jgi:hypothetical protein
MVKTIVSFQPKKLKMLKPYKNEMKNKCFYSYVDSFFKVFETNHNRLGWMFYSNKNDNYYFFIDTERWILNFIPFDILYN